MRIETPLFIVGLAIALPHDWGLMGPAGHLYFVVAGAVFVGGYGIDWLLERVRELWPEFAGGGVAYAIHQTFHAIWKRPTHFLIRKVLRKEIEHH